MPKRLAYLGVEYDLSDDWHVSLNAHWVADRQRMPSDARPAVDDYTLVNLSTSYRLSENVTTRLTVKNLTDKAIYEPSTGSISNDYKMAGRSAWFELEYALQQVN